MLNRTTQDNSRPVDAQSIHLLMLDIHLNILSKNTTLVDQLLASEQANYSFSSSLEFLYYCGYSVGLYSTESGFSYIIGDQPLIANYRIAEACQNKEIKAAIEANPRFHTIEFIQKLERHYAEASILPDRLQAEINASLSDSHATLFSPAIPTTTSSPATDVSIPDLQDWLDSIDKEDTRRTTEATQPSDTTANTAEEDPDAIPELELTGADLQSWLDYSPRP